MKVKFLVVRGQPQGKHLVLPRGEFIIGRGSECHIRPNSDWVSRQHCMLRVTDETVLIRDLGSTNGTLVNGTRILAEQPLSHGDQVQIGPLVFEVRLEETLTPPELQATAFPRDTLLPGASSLTSTETSEMPNLDRLPPAIKRTDPMPLDAQLPPTE